MNTPLVLRVLALVIELLFGGCNGAQATDPW